MTTLTDTRRQLIALAVKHSDQPFLARRYRMVATAYENLTKATGRAADNLRRSIGVMLIEIEQINRDGFYANPLAHLRGPRNAAREQA
jgi:hypothetical protein